MAAAPHALVPLTPYGGHLPAPGLTCPPRLPSSGPGQSYSVTEPPPFSLKVPCFPLAEKVQARTSEGKMNERGGQTILPGTCD